MVPTPTEEDKRWVEEEKRQWGEFHRRQALLKGNHGAKAAGYIFSGLFIFLFVAWLSNYDPNEPVKRCAAFSNDGKLTCLRYEGENVTNGTIDPSDACVKRVKYSDGTYVDYGIHPDEYCPED
jgi:hypothetical protein